MTRFRSVIWAAGAPVRLAIVALIKLYRVTLSGWLGGQCRFYPSCSHYAEEAVRAHGAIKGSALAVWRIARCGPFTAGGVDHVPARRSIEYDSVIPLEGT
ncbi:MAG TPA: membrane protein insertion efficiency factor YidD [Solirubrobacterales bacterium]|nr:membrane protein insertion efficiency factor YidD [Solirubrobacterales bacterium]